MAYNNFNKLMLEKKVIEIVEHNYVPEVTPYKWIWRAKVYPIYPMSYNTFLRIVNNPNFEQKLEKARQKASPLMKFAF
ncbi:MAG: hypothetical protein LBV02_04220 [Bacteroidales bacterium]|jgi:hypothetical protein|nr:hypothetical protein [Bacteroidales bacterium]